MQLNYQNNNALAANAPYIGQWQDNGTGPGPFGTAAGRYVRVTAYSDQPGSLAIYQSDSPSGLFDANLLVEQVNASGGALCKIEQVITAQFWQAIYTNGPTAQTVFQHYAWSTADLSLAILQQLQYLNQQILSLRGPKDTTKYDSYQAIR